MAPSKGDKTAAEVLQLRKGHIIIVVATNLLTAGVTAYIAVMAYGSQVESNTEQSSVFQAEINDLKDRMAEVGAIKVDIDWLKQNAARQERLLEQILQEQRKQ